MFRIRQIPIRNLQSSIRKLLINSNRTQTVDALQNNEQNYKEVRIPVPWGHIAGKWWGPQNKRPILLLHGWQDNCGSFDTLLPLLSKEFSYLAIDFLGHGLSSWFPKGMPYLFDHFVLIVRRLATYFEYKKLPIIAHSLGGMAAYKYGTLFPKEMEFVICFDSLYMPFIWREIEFQRMLIDNYIKCDTIDHSKEPPSYSIEDLKKRLFDGSAQSINIEKTSFLLNRNIKPSIQHPGKYYVTRDPLLRKGFRFYGSKKENFEDSNRVTFPLCCIFPEEDSPFFDKEDKYFNSVLNNIRKNSSDFQTYYVNATHHFHLNSPHLVSKIVNDFVQKHYDVNQPYKYEIVNKLL